MERDLAEQRLRELGDDWTLLGEERLYLEKTYRFADFAQALAFVNRVGAIAEQQDHHPDVQLSWGRVTLQIWTHRVKGLTENDFILAATCDRL